MPALPSRHPLARHQLADCRSRRLGTLHLRSMSTMTCPIFPHPKVHPWTLLCALDHSSQDQKRCYSISFMLASLAAFAG